ncbi:MAG: fatty acid--CoA ligase family protein [Thalassobaculaceae bacterium]|nr:fatty acid--CoA ligase family protein [Thalassobaculaceae bacterium]
MTVFADTLFAAMAAHGDAPAIVRGSAVMTHGELCRRSEIRAGELTEKGVGGFRPHPVFVDNSPGDLIELLGTYRAGGVVVPIHRATPPARVEELVARLVSDPMLDGASTIVFTSGTTGAPKAAVLSAERQTAKLDMIRREAGWRDGRRTLLALQLTFSFGQWVTWLTLLSGGALVFPERLSVDAVSAVLARAEVDRLPSVPTLIRGLLDQPATAALPGWKGAVMAGGEVLPAGLGTKIRAAWPQADIGDIYGLTETGTCDFFVDPPDYDAAAGSLGRPGADIETRIAEDGELRIRSPYAMIGYLRDADRTAEAFDADGYFRTGDLAEVREDGRVILVGRAKDLINKGGMKVAPLEVEAVLASHPDVAGALVAGVPDPKSGEAVIAVITAAPGREPVPERVLAWAGERLERYKLPSRLKVVAALPTGSTGKGDRGSVGRMFIESV